LRKSIGHIVDDFQKITADGLAGNDRIRARLQERIRRNASLIEMLDIKGSHVHRWKTELLGLAGDLRHSGVERASDEAHAAHPELASVDAALFETYGGFLERAEEIGRQFDRYERAKAALATSNLRLVVSFAKRFQGR